MTFFKNILCILKRQICQQDHFKSNKVDNADESLNKIPNIEFSKFLVY